MPSPRVSVICVFFEGERFIREALDSVLRQDFDDYEVLLVDDGSTDASTAIAQEFVREHPGRFRYLEHPGHANRGASPTRNLGLAEARGELIAFIDCDDVWRPGKLREQVAILDANPQADMLCGAVNYWDSWEGGEDRVIPTGHVRDGISYPPQTSLKLYPLGAADAPCPSDNLIRRAAMLAAGGFEENFTGEPQLYEDQTFYGRFYLSSPVYFSSRVWLDYRQHASSCVARVLRDGGYAESRRHYLTWFRPYVAASKAPGADRVLAAVDRALWELDHPTAGRVLRTLRALRP